MFYVIGSEIQSRVLLSTAPANRTKGVVEQFGTSGVPIPCRMKPTYGGTLVFSFLCSGLPLYHHYTDTSLIRQDSECLSLYSEFQRTKINGSRKSSLYWLGHLAANYQRSGKHFLKTALIYLQKKLSFSYLVQKISFQVVAVENALFMSAFAIIDNLFTFQDVFPSGSRWGWRFGECSQNIF